MNTRFPRPEQVLAPPQPQRADLTVTPASPKPGGPASITGTDPLDRSMRRSRASPVSTWIQGERRTVRIDPDRRMPRPGSSRH